MISAGIRQPVNIQKIMNEKMRISLFSLYKIKKVKNWHYLNE